MMEKIRKDRRERFYRAQLREMERYGDPTQIAEAERLLERARKGTES